MMAQSVSCSREVPLVSLPKISTLTGRAYQLKGKKFFSRNYSGRMARLLV
jgi:hypothetical protein